MPREAVPDEGRSQTYIVRMWLERTGGEGGPEWRGEIVRVPGGEKTAFRCLSKLADAVRRLQGSRDP